MQRRNHFQLFISIQYNLGTLLRCSVFYFFSLRKKNQTDLSSKSLPRRRAGIVEQRNCFRTLSNALDNERGFPTVETKGIASFLYLANHRQQTITLRMLIGRYVVHGCYEPLPETAQCPSAHDYAALIYTRRLTTRVTRTSQIT